MASNRRYDFDAAIKRWVEKSDDRYHGLILQVSACLATLPHAQIGFKRCHV